VKRFRERSSLTREEKAPRRFQEVLGSGPPSSLLARFKARSFWKYSGSAHSSGMVPANLQPSRPGFKGCYMREWLPKSDSMVPGLHNGCTD
jgi:hypothetical protein